LVTRLDLAFTGISVLNRHGCFKSLMRNKHFYKVKAPVNGYYFLAKTFIWSKYITMNFMRQEFFNQFKDNL
jgi:hypothetical protein